MAPVYTENVTYIKSFPETITARNLMETVIHGQQLSKQGPTPKTLVLWVHAYPGNSPGLARPCTITYGYTDPTTNTWTEQVCFKTLCTSSPREASLLSIKHALEKAKHFESLVDCESAGPLVDTVIIMSTAGAEVQALRDPEFPCETMVDKYLGDDIYRLGAALLETGTRLELHHAPYQANLEEERRVRELAIRYGGVVEELWPETLDPEEPCLPPPRGRSHHVPRLCGKALEAIVFRPRGTLSVEAQVKRRLVERFGRYKGCEVEEGKRGRGSRRGSRTESESTSEGGDERRKGLAVRKGREQKRSGSESEGKEGRRRRAAEQLREEKTQAMKEKRERLKEARRREQKAREEAREAARVKEEQNRRRKQEHRAREKAVKRFLII